MLSLLLCSEGHAKALISFLKTAHVPQETSADQFTDCAQTSTGATPYSLVYGMEAILPIKVQIPSLRIMKDAGLSEDDWVQTRLDQLNLIDEKRLTAVSHGQMYQKQMIKAFNKKVRCQIDKA